MTESQKIELRRSKVRERLGEIQKLSGDEYTDEVKAEERALQDEYTGLEQRHRTAIIAEDKALDDAKGEAGAGIDAEQRERIELRSKASLGTFIKAALTGKAVTGAEAELQAAAGVDGIPIELWDVPKPAEARSAHSEKRAITPAPGTVGINLDPIRPAVFAPSIADKVGIEMPKVASGTYATGTITTSVTADAVAKSTDVPQTAGAITVGTTTPHRVGASLALTLEDIAAIGTGNFESILRENMSMALSAELDDQLINGADANDDLNGLLNRLTDPAAPAANVETWQRFLTIQASGIDGLWATELADVAMVVNPETYRLAATTFQGNDAEDSAAMYMKRAGAGLWTNARMPDKANHIAAGILCRKGRPGTRLAVAPHWGSLSVDDIYSGARKGERYFTMSILVGDVIIVQTAAYSQVAFRVST